MDKTHYFYVLHCADQTFYGGYTVDLERRSKEHNSGKGAKYTRPNYRRPVRMIYAEAYTTRSEAMSAEYRFKAERRPNKEKYLAERGIRFPLQKSQAIVIQNEGGKQDESK